MTGNLVPEEIFTPGSRIHVEFVDENGVLRNCSTRVEDIEGTYLVIQAPLSGDYPIAFRESQELTLHRFDDQGSDAYVTNVFVIDIRQGDIPLLVCSRPQQIDKTSLRRYSRFGVQLPLKYSNSSINGRGQLIDLSLSGCSALVRKSEMIGEGSFLTLTFRIPGGSEITLEGKVIRVEETDIRGANTAAIQFAPITSDIREELYNFIFQLQLTSDSLFKPDRIE